MKLDRAMGLASLAAMVLMGALFLPKLLRPESALYRDLLTPSAILFIAAPIKLLFLFIAAVFASRSAASFDGTNPVRSAWLLLSFGLWAYVVAQSVLAFYQLGPGGAAPFPSVADLFFLPATVLLVVSLFSFLKVYKSVGFEVAETFEVGVVLLFVLSLLGVFFLVVARPVLASDAPLPERALNILYPVLDCILLIPAVLLLKMALSMRGGSLWKVWMALLLGLVFLAMGDVLFAVFTTLGQTSLDPLLDVVFAWSYILIARALVRQYSITAGEPG